MKAIKFTGSEKQSFSFDGRPISFKPGEIKILDDILAKFLYDKYYNSPLGSRLFMYADAKEVPLSVEVINKSVKDKTIYVENCSKETFCKTFDAIPFTINAGEKKVISEKVYNFFVGSWRGDNFPLKKVTVCDNSEPVTAPKPDTLVNIEEVKTAIEEKATIEVKHEEAEHLVPSKTKKNR